MKGEAKHPPSHRYGKGEAYPQVPNTHPATVIPSKGEAKHPPSHRYPQVRVRPNTHPATVIPR